MTDEPRPLATLSRSALVAIERDLTIRIDQATGDLRKHAERGVPGPEHYAAMMRVCGEIKAHEDQRFYVRMLMKEEERG